jgi:hypothetical protein
LATLTQGLGSGRLFDPAHLYHWTIHTMSVSNGRGRETMGEPVIESGAVFYSSHACDVGMTRRSEGFLSHPQRL